MLSVEQKTSAVAPHVEESWTRFERVRVKGRHRLTIDDFTQRAATAAKEDIPLRSEFSVAGMAFCLQVYLNGAKDQDNEDHVAAYLRYEGTEELEIRYQFLLETSGETTLSTERPHVDEFSKRHRGWGFPKLVSKASLTEKANLLLPKGRLTIICELDIACPDRITKGTKTPSQNQTDHAGLQEQMSGLFVNAAFSDISLVCGERSFACHKGILAARSDVFAAMFSHRDTSESVDGKVVITDIEPYALEKLLEFIYTDRCDIEAEMACGVLAAADKYNVPKLVDNCEDLLIDNLSINNFDQMLILAHLHEAKQLKTAAMKFVSENREEVKESPGWQVIRQEYPHIKAELCDFFMS